MGLIASLGAFVTLLAIGLVGCGGYLMALLVLPQNPGGTSQTRSDPLLVAIASILLALAQGIGISLVLGALDSLHLGLALAIQTLLVWGLYRTIRRRFATDWESQLTRPAIEVLYSVSRTLRRYPALSLVATLGAGTELLRGLFRPPLSWDSLMYHLFLAGTWLQQGSLDLVGAREPTTAYLFAPANGSLWAWWWIAPSHSEFWVNLAHFPSWVLLGLSAGAFARQLGAERHWPVAGFLTVLTPAVLRFVATQYVDILTAACLVTATVFAVRWIQLANGRDALLAGCALGLASGTKVIGLAFGLVLAFLALVLGMTRDPRSWQRRLVQVGGAFLIAVSLGGFFYGRNLALGAGPFGEVCLQPGQHTPGVLDAFPAPASVVALWEEVFREGLLLDSFLGSTRPTLSDLGVGPPVVLLFLVAPVLPFAVGRDRRRAAWLATGQVAAQLAFWVVVPYAANAHVLANVRYLDGALALLFAGAVALGERFLADAWLRGLALAVALQDVLMVRTIWPREVRILLALALALAVLLALSKPLRRALALRWKALVSLGCLVVVALAPVLAGHRVRDRERAFEEEFTAHATTTRMFAEGWGWLDGNAGRGTVAVSHAPENYFVYPAMGPFLERRAIYVHVNEEAHENPLRYPGCDVRVDPSPEAWLRNLRREGVRWLYVARFPEFEFPLEDRWARERPDLFALRYEDPLNRVYELILEGDTGPAAQ